MVYLLRIYRRMVIIFAGSHLGSTRIYSSFHCTWIVLRVMQPSEDQFILLLPFLPSQEAGQLSFLFLDLFLIRHLWAWWLIYWPFHWGCENWSIYVVRRLCWRPFLSGLQFASLLSSLLIIPKIDNNKLQRQ